MPKGYAIQIKGLDQLRKQFKNYPKIAGKHYRNAMIKSVTTIHRNVRPLVPTGVSGRLKSSIQWQVRGSGVNLTGVVGSTMKKETYPAVMEFGRKPGAKMPPPKALERWVWLKLKPPKKMVKSIAFTVARAIGRRGIKGKRFLQKGYEKSKRQVQQNFNKALADVVEELAKK